MRLATFSFVSATEESAVIVNTDTRRGGLTLHEEVVGAREEVAEEEAAEEEVAEDAELASMEPGTEMGCKKVDELGNCWFFDTEGAGGGFSRGGTVVGAEQRVTTCTLRLEPVLPGSLPSGPLEIFL